MKTHLALDPAARAPGHRTRNPETGIVPRLLIFDPGIAEADDELNSRGQPLLTVLLHKQRRLGAFPFRRCRGAFLGPWLVLGVAGGVEVALAA